MIVKFTTTIQNLLDDLCSNIIGNSNWIQVSSNKDAVTGDRIILKSPTYGDNSRNVYIQLKENTTYSSDTDQKASYCFYANLLESYSPAAQGSNGTIGGNVSCSHYVGYNAFGYNLYYNRKIKINVTLNIENHRIIFIFEHYGQGDSYTIPSVLYVGYPKDYQETSISFCHAIVSSKSNNVASASNYILKESSGDRITGPKITKSYPPFFVPNYNGYYTLSSIMLDSSSYGYFGILDGIYSLPNSNVRSGQILIDGTNQYLVVDTLQATNATNANISQHGFPTKMIAVSLQ